MHVAAGRVVLRPDADGVLRDGVERPQQLAVLGVKGFHEAADAIFAAVCADQHLALHDGRRHRLAVAELGIGDIHLPDLVAGPGIERHQLGVERREIDLVLIEFDAPIVRAAAIGGDRSERMLVVPELLAGLGVERVHMAERGGDIHHTIDHDRRRFEGLAHVGLEDPGRMQLLHVAGVDLLGWIEALLVVVAVGVQEVRRVAGGLVEHRLRDRRRVRNLGGLRAGVVLHFLG